LTYWSWQGANLNEVMLRYTIPFLRILQNKDVDVDYGATKNIMAWHFNRGLDEDAESAKRNYKGLIDRQLNGSAGFYDFISKDKANADNCKTSLEILGKISHAWQDYYAHAIRKETQPGVITYYNSEPGAIEGSPDNIGTSIVPSKFGYFGWDFWNTNLSEHGMTEPGFRAPDTSTRLSLAQDFVTQKYSFHLTKWWEACKCFKDDIKE